MEKEEITVMGERGQVVIPKEVRQRLKLAPKTKFLVVAHDDTVMLKKLAIPKIREEFEKLVEKINKRIAEHGELTEKEIAEEIRALRKEKE